jgi:hypothetical protein
LLITIGPVRYTSIMSWFAVTLPDIAQDVSKVNIIEPVLDLPQGNQRRAQAQHGQLHTTQASRDLTHDPPPEFDEDEALARWKKDLPSTRGMESSSATGGTTKFSADQIWAAEQTQLKRQKVQVDKRTAPIPEDDDSGDDTEPDDNIFDEHLNPQVIN